MRLKEGFTFAHSSSGIINMVLEVEMGPIGSDYSTSSNTLSCVIQYVLFPPHCSNRGEIREQNSGSEDETDIEQETEMELQMVTEVWIEPQYGQVVHSPPCRLYMESEPYYKLADKVSRFFQVFTNSRKTCLFYDFKNIFITIDFLLSEVFWIE